VSETSVTAAAARFRGHDVPNKGAFEAAEQHPPCVTNDDQAAFDADIAAAEIVNARAAAIGLATEADLTPRSVPEGEAAAEEIRHVYFDDPGEYMDTPIYSRSALAPESRLEGPAIVEQMDTTVLIPPGSGAHVDSRLNLIIEGSLGYFGLGLIDGPNVRIAGRVGWSCAENMMSGTILIEKNAGSQFGAAIRGGDLVCKGNVGSRTGIDMKGGTIIVGGDTGSRVVEGRQLPRFDGRMGSLGGQSGAERDSVPGWRRGRRPRRIGADGIPPLLAQARGACRSCAR